MSRVLLIDGKTGNIARVDSNNRVHCDVVQRTQSQNAILNGFGFNISTGLINLTSANESAIFYLKTNEDFTLVFKEILVIMSDSTNGTGNATIEIVSNPTQGTIIDNATAVNTNANRLFSSARTLIADVYKGAEGNTITNGDSFAISSRSSFVEPLAFDADIIGLKKGNSLAVKFTPPSGNTSQNVIVAATVFLEISETNGN